MLIIACNIQLFSYEQAIYVIDQNGGIITTYKSDIDDLVDFICNLAAQIDPDAVKLSGQSIYVNHYAENIQTTYALKYGKNNLKVEVVE